MSSDSFSLRDPVQNVPVDDFLAIGDIASIVITPSSPAITHPGTVQLVATATMDDGSTRDLSSTVSWSSASTNKATIDAAGLVTSVAAGTSVITATFGGKTATKTVTVS